MKTPTARCWHRQAWPWVLVGLVGGLLLTRWLLDPLAGWFTQHGLNRLHGFRGEFRAVHVSILRPAYRIEGLKIARADQPQDGRPLLYVEELEARPIFENLFKRDAYAVATLDGMRIDGTLTAQTIAQVKSRMNRLLPQLGQALRRIIPMRIKRIEVHDAEVLLVDATGSARPPLQIEHLDATLENFTSSHERPLRQPIVCAAHMRVQRSGDFSLFLVADPRGEAPTFAGQVELHEMPFADVYKLLMPTSDQIAVSGTIDLFMSFKSTKGIVTGGIRPTFTDVQIEAPQEALFSQLTKRLQNSGLVLFANQDLYGMNRPTVIPIRGKLTPANSELWPTVSTVISNSFAQGLATGLSGLPIKATPTRKGRKCCIR